MAIARTLLKNPPILGLTKPPRSWIRLTSAPSRRSWAAVAQGKQLGDCALFIHHRSGARNLVAEHGHIIERGTHAIAGCQWAIRRHGACSKAVTSPLDLSAPSAWWAGARNNSLQLHLNG